MHLAILFLCVLFSLLYVAGLVLIVEIWMLSARRADAFAKLAKRGRTPRSRAA